VGSSKKTNFPQLTRDKVNSCRKPIPTPNPFKPQRGTGYKGKDGVSQKLVDLKEGNLTYQNIF